MVGDHDLTDDQGDFYKVSSILKHPDYNGTLPVDYDFAILTLAKTITFSLTVAPICLPASVQADFAGEEVTVTGWGSTLTYGGPLATTLQQVDMQVMENSLCSMNGYEDWTAKRYVQYIIHFWSLAMCLLSKLSHLCGGTKWALQW